MDFLSFPEVPAGSVTGIELVYSHRYIGENLVSPADFRVTGGQLHIGVFSREEVQCLSLIISTIAQHQ